MGRRAGGSGGSGASRLAIRAILLVSAAVSSRAAAQQRRRTTTTCKKERPSSVYPQQPPRRPPHILALETLASALARELVKHGQSAQSARLAQDARLAYDELMEGFDVSTLSTDAQRNRALRTLLVCNRIGVGAAIEGDDQYSVLRYRILSTWFADVTARYASLNNRRALIKAHREYIRQWEDRLGRRRHARHSAEAQTVRALHVQLANVQEALVEDELAVDDSARAYAAASKLYPPR